MKGWVPDPPRLGPFHFGPSGAPLDVTVRRLVVKPGSDGPRGTGEAWVRRYVNGRLVTEEHTEPGAES